MYVCMYGAGEVEFEFEEYTEALHSKVGGADPGTYRPGLYAVRTHAVAL